MIKMLYFLVFALAIGAAVKSFSIRNRKQTILTAGISIYILALRLQIIEELGNYGLLGTLSILFFILCYFAFYTIFLFIYLDQLFTKKVTYFVLSIQIFFLLIAMLFEISISLYYVIFYSVLLVMIIRNLLIGVDRYIHSCLAALFILALLNELSIFSYVELDLLVIVTILIRTYMLKSSNKGIDFKTIAKTKFSLTKRELEILELLLLGNDNKYISEKLFISAKTANNHIYNIYKKCSVSTRGELFHLFSHINGLKSR